MTNLTAKKEGDGIALNIDGKEYKVHPDHEEEFWELVKRENDWDELNLSAIILMKTSFPCDSLKDRIEIIEEEGLTKFMPNKYWAVIKPLPLPMEESQEETQAQLWNEVLQMIDDKKAAYLMKNFLITRNK